jgi:hypothetical protein
MAGKGSVKIMEEREKVGMRHRGTPSCYVTVQINLQEDTFFRTGNRIMREQSGLWKERSCTVANVNQNEFVFSFSSSSSLSF